MPAPLTNESVLDQLAQTSIQLLLKEPYYGHFFTGLLRQVSLSVPTLGVCGVGASVILSVNPEFWQQELTDANHRLGVVKHEILHLVFRHIFRHRDFANKQIFNVAADLVVNQYVADNQLPEGAIRLSSFPSLKLEANQTVDQYYQQLIQSVDLSLSSGKGSTVPTEANQQVGSEMELDNSLAPFFDPQHPAQERHRSWNQITQANSGEQTLMENQINQAMVQAIEKTSVKDRGLLPAFLNRYLDDFQQSLKPKINWRRVVRMFAESSSRTYLKNTLKRPSKRYGTTPGIKIRRRQKFLVAVDTSGSVSQEELQIFFSEVYHLWKRGAEILVVECDADIGQVWPYSGQSPQIVTGGGGTDFNPPIAYANQQHHPDAIFYFTDGYAPAPDQPSRAPILWILSQEGIDLTEANSLPGRCVKLNQP